MASYLEESSKYFQIYLQSQNTLENQVDRNKKTLAGYVTAFVCDKLSQKQICDIVEEYNLTTDNVFMLSGREIRKMYKPFVENDLFFGKEIIVVDLITSYMERNMSSFHY